MKKNNYMKEMIFFMTLMLIFSYGAFPWANSARSQWTGVTSTGAIITNKYCPIVVEKEELTFDVQEFPMDYYDKAEKYLAYEGKVTARYNFYNPADYTVHATLVFPFGNAPAYYDVYDSESNSLKKNIDGEKYDITVNDAPIEKELRHTFSYYPEEFNIKDDMAKLNNEYMKDKFYSPDTPVTKYTYTIRGVDKTKYKVAYTSFFLSSDSSKTKVFLEDGSIGSSWDNGVRIGRLGENNASFALYVIGDPLEKMPFWNIYDDVTEEKKIDGEIKLTESVSLTFKDLAFINYNEASMVSEYDWYNSFVASFNENEWEQGYIGIGNDFNPYLSLMRWYQYDIVLEPGERITNEVTAPLYPSIDKSYNPTVYSYTYLLSPAQTWADFGPLEININTPYFITDSGLEGFIKTDKGYTLKLDGLPHGELEFQLSTGKKPKESTFVSSYMIKFIVIILALGAGVFLISGGLISIIMYLSKKHTDRNKK
ncbi:hypothetical protein ACPWSR_12255 [Alloiococcus sp. CFN-8]|uniref:hypothetical protein n=1 Tax=Alloiococcus sp. CFN-8 TaxID=3416081 RepID=UPI003CF8B020